MSWSFEKARKWERFHQLSGAVRRKGLGSAEWRELGALVPADSLSQVPASDYADPATMVDHVRQALILTTGIEC